MQQRLLHQRRELNRPRFWDIAGHAKNGFAHCLHEIFCLTDGSLGVVRVVAPDALHLTAHLGDLKAGRGRLGS